MNSLRGRPKSVTPKAREDVALSHERWRKLQSLRKQVLDLRQQVAESERDTGNVRATSRTRVTEK